MVMLCDRLEKYIKEKMEENRGEVIIFQRNILAHQFDCSPSQINYVLSTRFTNTRGYIVESRRGGGGYVRVFKVNNSKYCMTDLDESIGDNITVNEALNLIELYCEKNIISDSEGRIMKSAVGERAFARIYYEDRNKIRADILKEMMLATAEQ